jgi:hypothetical protein
MSELLDFSDLASAIEWAEGLRSFALAAATACMQQSVCAAAPSHDECQRSADQTFSASENALGTRAPDSTCTQEQSDAYHTIIDSMNAHFSRHTAIMNPLVQSVRYLNSLSPSAPLPLLHTLIRAAQALRHSIALHHSLLLALSARPISVFMHSSLLAKDPVLQSLASQGALAELLAAQRAAHDLAASIVA